MNKLFITLILIILPFDIFGQNKLTYNYIDKQDRVTIIKLAKDLLNAYLELQKDSSFDFTLIDTVKIYKNKTDYRIRFMQRIFFIPINSNYYYGFDVDPINKTITKVLGLNDDLNYNTIKFFHPTIKDLNKIEFVKKSLSLSVKESITILEKEKYYEILYISSGEKVDKISGKRFDWWDELLNLDPDKEFTEVKFNE